MKTSFFSAALVVSTVLCGQADVLSPSGGDDTAVIQAAIDAAPDGGSVTLGDGEFLITSQIEIVRDVTLKSQNGRSATTIRQTRTELPSGVTSLANRVLYLNHAKAVADGLKLTGGKALGTAAASSNGAGVKIDADGGQLLNCDVCGNQLISGVNFGGVYLASADGIVSNCLIHANGAMSVKSHAPGLYASAGLVTDCDIFCNTNNPSGTGNNSGSSSGVYLDGPVRMTRTAVSNNVYAANKSGSYPSALYAAAADVHVDNCLVVNNWSGVTGRGTVYVAAGTVTNCTIVGNVIPSGATGAGVAIATGTAKSAFARLYGCVIAGNHAGSFLNAGVQSGNNVVISHCVSDVALAAAASCTVVDCTTGDIRLNADYSLAFDSIGFNRCPAEDYAEIVAAVDFFGRPRLSGSAVEAGFAEYQLGAYEPLVRLSAEELPENTTLTATVTDPPEFTGTITYAWQVDGGTLSAWSAEKTANFTVTGVGAHTLTLHVRVNGVEQPTSSVVAYRVSRDFIYVDTDDDLQAAIDLAGVGTTVVLDDGVYELKRELVIRKPLILKSKNGAAQTTLVQTQTDCPSGVTKMQARHLTISDGAVVDGLTLTGGHWIGSEASASSEPEYGSSVRIEEPGGSLVNCHVIGNTAGRWHKAAVYVSAADALVSNCLIRANTTVSGGRSYHPALDASGGLITHCDISCNTNSPNGTHAGCGANLSGTARISHCTLTNNAYLGRGSTPSGSALVLSSDYNIADNCLIANNISTTTVACPGVYASCGVLTNCTITGNQTKSTDCAGLRVDCPYAANKVFIYGCVVSGNTSATEGSGDWKGTTGANNGRIYVARSLTPSGFSSTSTRVTRTDCLTATAVFEDPAAGDYRLATSSEGRDTCPPSDYSAEFLAAGDLAGKDRLSGDAVDMGAYERQQVAIEISVTGDDTKAAVGGTVRCTASIDGSSAAGALCAWSVDGGVQSAWSESRTFDYTPQTVGTHVVRLYVKLTDDTVLGPYAWNVWCAPPFVYVARSGNVPTSPYDTWEKAASDITTALGVSAGGTTVTVGDGVYAISEQLEIDRGIVLRSRNGAAVTEVSNTVQVVNRPCRLVYLNHPQARCEGFTLSGGYAANSDAATADTRLRGTGVLIGASGGTLASCVVTNCVIGSGNQGSVALTGDGALVTNCTVFANRSPTGNVVGSYAVGVWMSAGLVTDSRILDNYASVWQTKRGGTVYLSAGRMTRCTISGNRAALRDHTAEYVGAVQVSGSGSRIDNCLVSDNDGDGRGTGICVSDGGQVLNCTVVRNSGYFGSAGIQAVSADAVVRNCLVQDNVLKEGTTSTTTNLAYAADACVSYCLSPDPMPADQGNVTGMVTLRRDDRPRSRSLAQDAGSTDGYDCGTLDLLRNPRVRGRSIDIGCHEVPNTGLSVLVR